MQEVIIPIIVYTLENKLLGMYLVSCQCSGVGFDSSFGWVDLFDNMYELIDSLTFKLRTVSPSMWPIFELTYKLFKSDAVDFLEGESLPCTRLID